MSWVKVDDGFFAHWKIVELTPAAKLLFLGALTHCAAQLTDGVVSVGALRSVAGLVGVKHTAAKELVAVGLWHELGHDCDGPHCDKQPPPGAYLVHDYLEYQPSGEEERAKKEHLSRVRAEAGRRGGQRSGEVRRTKQTTPFAEAKADVASVCSKQNRSTDEAPTPNPLDSYLSLQHPTEAVDNPAGREDTTRGNNLATLLANACSGRQRATVEREADTVVDHLTKYVDRRLVEEAAAQAQAAHANLPRWVLPVVRTRAQTYGITIPPHPTLERNR